MSARAISSATVSFGLVSIPVKVYAASEHSAQVSFNMLHKECGTRVKQQLHCPKCDVDVPRNETTRGYEFAKGQYVTLTEEEYKALQEVADQAIKLVEFVPENAVDPVYYDRPYYLGPDKGGDRAYKLLVEAMKKTKLHGIARYSARGKQYLVMVRPQNDHLVMHNLNYADEVKSLDEVPLGEAKPATKGEIDMATQIIKQIAKKTFTPKEYEDEVKTRMLDLIQKKIDSGEEIVAPEEAPQAQIIDLMDALKASLGQRKGAKPAASRRAAPPKKAKTAAKRRSR
jgi:DNA end-binding protein Ku